MSLSVPILEQAYADTSLSARDLQVWRATTWHLDVVGWRRMKLSALEVQSGLTKSTLSEALTRLIAAGYLERREEDGSYLYRIPFSRGEPTALPEASAPAPTESSRPARRRVPRVLSRGVL